MEYRIVVTLGPQSDSPSVWADLIAAGATGFRLNTSHLAWSALQRWLERLDRFFGDRHPRVPLVLDLQGSKWRLGRFAAFELAPEQEVTLVCAAEARKPGVLPVPHEDFFRAAPVSSSDLVLDDAKIGLKVIHAREDSLIARVIAGGTIRPRKGIT